MSRLPPLSALRLPVGLVVVGFVLMIPQPWTAVPFALGLVIASCGTLLVLIALIGK
jgi:hypothetical protein